MKFTRVFFACALAATAIFTSFASAATPSNLPGEVGLRQDLIYFVLPDRYRNGDPSNDTSPGFNPKNTAFFHGGDLKGLTGNCTDDEGLARIKKLGFTAIWLSPLVVQQPPIKDGAGYHGYWGIDFTNVEPSLGTKNDLKNLSDCAKKLGLKLILDVVTNHTGDIIAYNNRTAYIPEQFKTIKNPAWLNDLTNYHNSGDIGRCWSSGSCIKNGDFYGLDDLATEKTTVYQGWADVYGSWISEYGFAGFRVDTARHLDDSFFKHWSPLISEKAKSSGIRDFTIFGEVWEQNPVVLMSYVRENKMQTALDFPFQRVATEYAAGSSDASVLKNLFSYDDYYISAQSSPANLVTFLGNHDMGRAAFMIRRARVNPESELLSRVQLANTLMYLSRGIPVTYYGDEVGILGSDNGNDQMARQDLFPTQVEKWKAEKRVVGEPIGEGDSFKGTFSNPIAQHLMALAQLRIENPALSNGPMQIRYAKESIFAFSKRESAGSQEYVVVLNNSPKRSSARFSTSSLGGWELIFGAARISTDKSNISIDLEGLQFAVLKAKSPISASGVKISGLRIKEDFSSGYYNLSAKVSTQDLVQAEFFIRPMGSKKWTSLGTDFNSPFNVFINPKEFSGKLQARVIVNNSNGRRNDSSIANFTIASS